MSLVVDHVKLPRRDKTLEYHFALPKGSCMAVMGKSGVGKSSLLHLISGFEAPVSGAISFDAMPFQKMTPGQRPLTILFQQYNLFDHLSVWDNVALGVKGTLYLKTEEKDLVQEILEKMGLLDVARKKPLELSGGEQQRAALARCILRKKPLLLLDEPFNALDPKHRLDLVQLLKKIQKEYRLTTLIVTHDVAEARALAPLTMFLGSQKVIAIGPTEEVLASPHPEIRSFQQSSDVLPLRCAS